MCEGERAGVCEVKNKAIVISCSLCNLLLAFQCTMTETTSHHNIDHAMNSSHFN